MARPKPQGENITTQRIAALIQERRYTQVAIAEMMDCAEGTVSRWVRGKTNMSAANLKKLASILDTTTDYLRGCTNAKTADEQAQMEADEAAYWDIEALSDDEIKARDEALTKLETETINRDKQRRTIRSRFFAAELGFTYGETKSGAAEFEERPYILKDRNGVEYRFSPEEFSMLMYQLSADIVSFACKRMKGSSNDLEQQGEGKR